MSNLRGRATYEQIELILLFLLLKLLSIPTMITCFGSRVALTISWRTASKFALIMRATIGDQEILDHERENTVSRVICMSEHNFPIT